MILLSALLTKSKTSNEVSITHFDTTFCIYLLLTTRILSVINMSQPPQFLCVLEQVRSHFSTGITRLYSISRSIIILIIFIVDSGEEFISKAETINISNEIIMTLLQIRIMAPNKSFCNERAE